MSIPSAREGGTEGRQTGAGILAQYALVGANFDHRIARDGAADDDDCGRVAGHGFLQLFQRRDDLGRATDAASGA